MAEGQQGEHVNAAAGAGGPGASTGPPPFPPGAQGAYAGAPVGAPEGYGGAAPGGQPGAQPQQFGGAPAVPHGAPPHPGAPVEAGAPQGQPPGPPYTSPIPIKRTHLGHALASEWTKICSVRSTVWTLGVMFVLVVGIGLLTALALSGEENLGMPLLAPGLFGLMLGQLAVITLGVLVVTSEYGTGMIRTTMTACPARGRVLLAKIVVFFVLAFALTTAACALTALLNSALLTEAKAPVEDGGGQLTADSGEWLGATVGAGLYVALLGLLALGVGALLRHSAGAITVMLGVVLLPLVISLFMISDSLATVRDKLIEYAPLNGLATLYGIPMSGETDASGWPLLGLLAGVTAAVLVGAYALLSTRDV